MRSLILLFVLLGQPIYGQFEIGHTTITYQDPDRNNRNILTEIYYPADVQGDDVAVAEGQFPTIVFGHGFVMVWSAYTNIWEHLVPRGYIMAFPRTEGNLFPNHQAFGQDLAFLISALELESVIPGALLNGHLSGASALMGHSMGGGCAFLAGEQVEVSTIIGLAPAETNTSAIDAASGVSEPVLVYSGDADQVTPPQNHHIPIYNATASDCKHFINIAQGSHCYYANSNFNCDLGEFNPGDLSRSEQHEVLYNSIDPWLAYHLKNECSAFDLFISNAANDNRIALSGDCPEVGILCSDPSCDADFNADGLVNSGDLTLLLGQFNCDGDCMYDVNADNLINSTDLALFLVAYGVECI